MGFSDMLKDAQCEAANKVLAEAKRVQGEIKKSDILLVSAMLYCAEGGDYESCVDRALKFKSIVDVKYEG